MERKEFVHEVYKHNKKVAEFNTENQALDWIIRQTIFGNDEMDYDVRENKLTEIYQYYNPHPRKKLVGDCVKRAITKAYNMDYMEVQRGLNRYKTTSKASVYNERRNWIPYIERELNALNIKGYNNMRVWDFARKHPKGTYILTVRKHAVAIVDG